MLADDITLSDAKGNERSRADPPYGVIPWRSGCLCRTGMFVLRFVWLAGAPVACRHDPGMNRWQAGGQVRREAAAHCGLIAPGGAVRPETGSLRRCRPGLASMIVPAPESVR